jgi:hypothetical protein
MHTTDRRAALIAILLGVLTVFLLSACGAPDHPASAAQPTASTGLGQAAAPTAVADTTTTAPTSDTITAEPTAVTSDATTAATAVSTAATETAPVSDTTAVTQTAATATPAVTGDTDPFTGTDDITDTDDVTVTVAVTSTGTVTVTQPVAVAIADYFTVPVSEVITLHADGLGFGEIARAYFLARELAADGDPTNDLTAAQILAMHQGGMGWGQIVVSLDLPHGNSGRNLGLIMRAHKEHPHTAVGVVSTGAEREDEHGPAAVPPGKQKDKDKNHGNGGGNGNGHGKGKGNGKKGK